MQENTGLICPDRGPDKSGQSCPDRGPDKSGQAGQTPANGEPSPSFCPVAIRTLLSGILSVQRPPRRGASKQWTRGNGQDKNKTKTKTTLTGANTTVVNYLYYYYIFTTPAKHARVTVTTLLQIPVANQPPKTACAAQNRHRLPDCPPTCRPKPPCKPFLRPTAPLSPPNRTADTAKP